MRLVRNSVLATAVPAKRGHPSHYEHDDLTAATVFNAKGKVTEIHTPNSALQRVHEIMHARHTNEDEYAENFAGLHPLVGQMIEDARLHLTKWPWQETPKAIVDAINDYMKLDIASAESVKHPGERFLIAMRQRAVFHSVPKQPNLKLTDFGSVAESKLYNEVATEIILGNVRAAAEMVQTAFFGPQMEPHETGKPGKRKPRKPRLINAHPLMEIIDLPKTEPTSATESGYRRATSGTRMVRHLLRKPVLPQRLFLRRAPVEPAGTILIDASGSMGGFGLIERTARASPQATVAYYAGYNGGWLYIYSRGGMRARVAEKPPIRGNVVDGPAIDWLMQQDGPRVMITDREFTGAADSKAQIVRLAMLEAAGEIEVRNFEQK